MNFLHSESHDRSVSSAPDVRIEKDTKPRQSQQSVTKHREEELTQELSREREASAHLRQLVTRNETTVQQILSDTSQQISRLRQEKDSQIQQLQQQLGVARRENDSQIQQLQQQLADLRRDKDAQVQHHQQHLSTQTQQLQQHLADLRTEKEAQIQQLQQQLADVSREKEAQIQQLQLHLSFQEIEFWRVSAEEVQVDQEILGGGAWGVVSKGKFRGQNVAVKRVYPSILQPTTVDRIRREIRTMAQVQHPNLVLFIAAVIDDRPGPMIITEILDTSLRSAYERNRLGSNKLRIFQDVASALNYLHLHREPIIHRDVSSANVLLEAVANNGWKAKLSDFGSANLVRYATTPGEGAIIYTAPEAFPQPPTSPTPPPPQTPKIDVYSYGVLLGEVVTQQLPDPDRLQRMIQQVRMHWPQLHPLVTGCIQHNPDRRPTMAYILEELNKLTP